MEASFLNSFEIRPACGYIGRNVTESVWTFGHRKEKGGEIMDSPRVYEGYYWGAPVKKSNNEWACLLRIKAKMFPPR
jgi:hypothetical protein